MAWPPPRTSDRTAPPAMGGLAPTLARSEPATYFDRGHNIVAAKLLPGEYHVVSDDIMLVTVLGSCVSACIRDPRLGIGGMNHFMLPESNEPAGSAANGSTRYGARAMETLVDELLKLGGRRDCLEAKVFGGGAVMAELMQANVGERNAAFVVEFLRRERIALAAHDLLDIYPRKVCYFPRTGRVLVKRLRHLHNDTILQRERVYRQRLHEMESDGERFS